MLKHTITKLFLNLEEEFYIEIIGGLLFVAILICWGGSLLGGASATINQKERNQMAFNEMLQIHDAEWTRLSKENDVYYQPDPHVIIPPNLNFYSDGSLKHDDITRRFYPKGQYFCKCDGTRADNSTAPSNMKRPPRG